MIMVGKIASAAFARAAIPENQREDFYLYADEFQNITTRTIPTILSELRKYRLSFTMAHQFIAQVKDEVRDAIFGNVGTMVSFRVSNPDGEVMKKYFAPVFNETDLVGLANYNAYVRLMLDGEPARAFNMATIRPEEVNISYRNEVIENSNMTYGRIRKEVDKEIMDRFFSYNRPDEEKEEVKEEEDEAEFDEDFLNDILASMNKGKEEN